jgi:hypothetical protein
VTFTFTLWRKIIVSCFTSGFRREVDENCALFWVITQQVVVISYRRFGTIYWFHAQGSRIQNKKGIFEP